MWPSEEKPQPFPRFIKKKKKTKSLLELYSYTVCYQTERWKPFKELDYKTLRLCSTQYFLIYSHSDICIRNCFYLATNFIIRVPLIFSVKTSITLFLWNYILKVMSVPTLDGWCLLSSSPKQEQGKLQK